jgi:hypothetical protein
MYTSQQRLMAGLDASHESLPFQFMRLPLSATDAKRLAECHEIHIRICFADRRNGLYTYAIMCWRDTRVPSGCGMTMV